MENIQNLKTLMFECPVCKTQTDLLTDTHFRKNLDLFIKEREQQIIEAAKLEERTNNEKNHQILLSNQANELNLKFEQIISQKEKDLSLLKQELEQNTKTVSLEVEKKYTEVIHNLNTEKAALANKMKAEIIDLENSKNNEISLLKNNYDNFGKNLELQIEAKYKDQLNLLKEDLNKITAENNAKITELNNNKELIVKEITQAYELKILEEKEQAIVPYRKEIEELKIANAQNKLIHSKVKGENFEHEVEGLLRTVFELDNVEKINITTDNTKADFEHKILVNNQVAGTIIYEVKNANWSESWEEKLSVDIAKMGHKYGILVATSFNDRYKGIPFKRSQKNPNIWMTDADSFVFVAQILKNMIITTYELQSKILKLNNIIQDSSDAEMVKVLNEYKDRMDKLNLFWEKDMPVTMKVFRKEFANLESIVRTLNNSSNKIEKSKERIEKQLNKKIVDTLQKILGPINYEDVEIDEEETDLDNE